MVYTELIPIFSMHFRIPFAGSCFPLAVTISVHTLSDFFIWISNLRLMKLTNSSVRVIQNRYPHGFLRIPPTLAVDAHQTNQPSERDEVSINNPARYSSPFL